MAEFFGGTSRYYLYWIKSELKNPEIGDSLSERIKNLNYRKIVDIRDFIIGESDVDIVAEQRKMNSLKKDELKSVYRVKAIDLIIHDVLDTNVPRGRNEKLQAHIPVEKI